MRLLVAEDEKDLAQAIEAILKHHQYEVEVVHNGTDALFYAQSTDYDALILDVMMPGLTGIQVVEKLRAENFQTPILLLTAKSQLEDKIEGLNAGSDDYLTKPFEALELVARVRAMLRRPAEFVATNTSFADLILNRDQFELSVGDQKVTLNNKEFQLLEFLVRNQKQILSKDLIMERVWGLDSDAEINVVWVNISSLRKKLAQINSKVQISAVRGVGYKLEVAND